MSLEKMAKILIYSTSSCPWCIRVKEFLKANKILFTNKDVSNEKNANEMFKKSKQKGVPVIDIDGEVIIGFDEKKLKKILNL